jgi:hypothetical protein
MTWIVVLVAIVVAAAIIAVLVMRRQERSATLRTRFGPEYDRVLAETGSRSQAEAELIQRGERHEGPELRPLEPEVQDAFRTRWHQAEAQFALDPRTGIAEADRLIRQAMLQRGYPAEAFEGHASVVGDPGLAERYRQAHAAATVDSSGLASTQNYRRAMQDYRLLLGELVDQEAMVQR